MRQFLIVLAALLALIVAGIGAFFFFFPKDLAIAEVKKQVQTSTGRTLDIDGPVDLSIFPTVGFTANDVRLSNPQGFAGAPFLTARKITFAVALTPLFKGDIEVRRLILDQPVFTLLALKDGAANWVFPEQPPKPGEAPQKLKSLRLDDMRLIDGALTFIGADGGDPLQVEDIDAVLDLKSLDQPAQLDGSARYRGQTLDFGANIGAPRATLEKGATPVRFTVNAPAVKGALDGTMDTATGVITGRLDTSGASARTLLDWLGSPLPAGPGFGAFEVKSDFMAKGPSYAFTKGAFRIDAVNATGDVNVTVGETGRLTITGGLAIPVLDTNVYLPAPPAAANAPGGAAAGGVNTAAAWDAKPMDLAGLRSLDADLQLAVSDLRFQKMQFTGAQLGLRLNQGIADARLSRIALYGGAGTARLVVDARDTAAKITTELDVTDVQALPLLTAAIGLDKIEGRGALKANLTGSGRSQADIMRTLSGTTSFTFNDGAWRGVNLAQVARTVQAAISGGTVGAAAKTDFAEFAAAFQVSNGIAMTNDLRLLNPFVRLEGAGAIDIGAQTINMRLTPRAVRSIEGQGATAAAQGIGVPFKVSGPWSKPAFAPDLGNVVQSQVQRALERNNLGGLSSIIGGQQKTNADPAAKPETTVNPLEQLLKRKK